LSADVKRISSYWFYELGSAMRSLKSLQGGAILAPFHLDLARAGSYLQAFIDDASTFEFPAAKRAASRISDALERFM